MMEAVKALNFSAERLEKLFINSAVAFVEDLDGVLLAVSVSRKFDDGCDTTAESFRASILTNLRWHDSSFVFSDLSNYIL